MKGLQYFTYFPKEPALLCFGDYCLLLKNNFNLFSNQHLLFLLHVPFFNVFKTVFLLLAASLLIFLFTFSNLLQVGKLDNHSYIRIA